MPYIEKQKRSNFKEELELLSDKITSEGDLNYIITYLIHKRIQKLSRSYKTINDLIGMLECSKLELYRIIAAPYEDVKKHVNGNVSILDK